MSVGVLRSEQPAGNGPPARQRAEGRIGLAVERFGMATRPVRIAEAGSARVRLPRGWGRGLEAVLINTAGGLCCGDGFRIEIEAGAGAQVEVTTSAAEKVYRSDGALAELAVRFSLAPGADVAWLPQETILYDQARLRRSFTADLAPDARMLLFEATAFGRAAHGERMSQGHFQDSWRIHRGGRLIYADAVRLSGPVDRLLDRPSVAGGCRVMATALCVAPDAEGRLDEARALLDRRLGVAGASAWNGVLAVRFLARTVSDLRHDAARFLEGFRGRPLPRVWH